MSQIGYMMLAVGLGPIGYAFGIMHLLTHGFFKAGLFLGAGSVMHGMNDEVDMRRYGGLRKFMPVTFCHLRPRLPRHHRLPAVRRVLLQGQDHRGRVRQGRRRGLDPRLVALLGAGLTAFYMTRLMIMTFFGEPRAGPKDAHPHESPRVMTIPMIVLAFGSLVAGCLLVLGGVAAALPGAVGRPSVEEGAHTIAPAVLTVAHAARRRRRRVAAAWWLVGRKPVPVEQPLNVTPLTWAARRSLYGDALNESLFMRPGAYLTRALVFFDGRGVDGAVNGLAAARRRDVRTAATRADRLRPLLRAVHARRRAARQPPPCSS